MGLVMRVPVKRKHLGRDRLWNSCLRPYVSLWSLGVQKSMQSRDIRAQHPCYYIDLRRLSTAADKNPSYA